VINIIKIITQIYMMMSIAVVNNAVTTLFSLSLVEVLSIFNHRFILVNYLLSLINVQSYKQL
jgi:hypothetical protein